MVAVESFHAFLSVPFVAISLNSASWRLSTNA